MVIGVTTVEVADDIVTAPPFRLSVAGPEAEPAKVKEPVPVAEGVGTIEMVPLLVATVPDNPLPGTLICKLTLPENAA